MADFDDANRKIIQIYPPVCAELPALAKWGPSGSGHYPLSFFLIRSMPR